jgi:GMP synthase (glutamine-hydrolysing)
LLVIKAGAAVPEVVARRRDFEVWIATGAGLRQDDMSVVEVFRDEPLPDPASVAASVRGVVVTGSPAMVTDKLPWSERTAQWLREYVLLGKPVLGICYGHQLLAHAFGGEVNDNPAGRQIGTIDVTLNAAAKSDALFGRFAEVLHVPVSHVQSVIRLPEGAQLLGASERDPHHVFRYGSCAWGVQFHPEFDAGIVRGYIDARRDQLRAEGLDAASLAENATDTADGTFVLRRFAELAKKHGG